MHRISDRTLGVHSNRPVALEYVRSELVFAVGGSSSGNSEREWLSVGGCNGLTVDSLF